MKNLGAFKKEILRYTQNDKIKSFDCLWVLAVHPLGGANPVKPYLGTGFSMGSILRGFLRMPRRDFSASRASSWEENGPSQT